MERTVWFSRIMSDYSIGDRQGLAHKWFGRDWDPPAFIAPSPRQEMIESLKRYIRGEPLERDEFPEALFIFDERRFRKLGDLFTAGPFFAVKGKLSDVLLRFDLGEGALIPLPIYREDKITKAPGNYFIWKLGARKRGFVPDESPAIKPWGFGGMRQDGLWSIGSDVQDFDIAVYRSAVIGPPDVWCDSSLHRSLFFSNALAEAIRSERIEANLHLCRCRLI